MEVNGILLNGDKLETIKIDNENGMDKILKLLNIKEFYGYHTFGDGYTAFWQEERKEKTSMEITVMAGASYPIFIDSKVIITKEDEEGNYLDINFRELKDHFNMDHTFWALIKN